MNNIYNEIGKLTEEFKRICYGLTTNKNDIENAVQELMLYFLSMNKKVLEDIYTKDGKKGIIKYGCVVLHRALRSPRSPFYYKYRKYYTKISSIYETNSTLTHREIRKTLENMPRVEIDNNQWQQLEKIDIELDKMYWYDRDVFKLYYYEGNTLDSLAKKTKISRNSLFITIDKVRTKLKEILDE